MPDGRTLNCGHSYIAESRMNVSIDLVFKIAAIGILLAVLNSLLTRAGREDIATLTSIAGLIIVLMMVIDMVSNLFESVKGIFGLY